MGLNKFWWQFPHLLQTPCTGLLQPCFRMGEECPVWAPCSWPYHTFDKFTACLQIQGILSRYAGQTGKRDCSHIQVTSHKFRKRNQRAEEKPWIKRRGCDVTWMLPRKGPRVCSAPLVQINMPLFQVLLFCIKLLASWRLVGGRCHGAVGKKSTGHARSLPRTANFDLGHKDNLVLWVGWGLGRGDGHGLCRAVICVAVKGSGGGGGQGHGWLWSQRLLRSRTTGFWVQLYPYQYPCLTYVNKSSVWLKSNKQLVWLKRCLP